MSVPVARTSPGGIPFTVACVPTGIKAGVRTLPCSVSISPRRAAPSVPSNVNANGNGLCSTDERMHFVDHVVVFLVLVVPDLHRRLRPDLAIAQIGLAEALVPLGAE